ncbi:MAG: orotidine-5'-phosphate decarboxylase [Bacteroidales bacterium]|nr:orotidine-5'-phosphate decarboxylase [Bacteroidales bacterium]
MTYNQLVEQIGLKRSFLCVGLDSDRSLLPAHLQLHPQALFLFNKEVIDSTAAYAVAYKLNTAFYEAEGTNGWAQLSQTVSYIRERHPNILVIADAKRGDISNTAKHYARAFFEEMNVDALTLSPYMGTDSLTPFLEYKEKWTIILALTSNSGASDFELQLLANGQPLYEAVIQKSCTLGAKEQLMFVVGATHPQQLVRVRALLPEHFLLVPGVGAQGGSLEEVVQNGMNDSCGLLVNMSRGIIFADNSRHFADAAGLRAKEMTQKMSALLPQSLVG